MRAGEVAAELLNVLDFGAAPSVNRLIVVAHHHQITAATGEHAQPRVLNGVGVLKLIHQNVSETALIMIEDLRVFQPQFVGAQQNFAEVDHAAAIAGDLIGSVNAQHGFGVFVAEVVDVACTQAFVFLAVDIPLALFGGPALFVDLQFSVDAFDEAQLIVAIEDLEVLNQSSLFPVRPQQSVSKSVKRAYPHAAERLPHEGLDPVPHLAGRFIGEGYGENREG